MLELFKLIPMDILINILSYDGSIKYRNGKFIDQIKNDDERYKLLNQISPVKTILLYNNSYPIGYRRDLGSYEVNLKIDTAYEDPKYRFVFKRKREKGDTSIIVLYYYKLK
jgi:hypothetical protein